MPKGIEISAEMMKGGFSLEDLTSNPQDVQVAATEEASDKGGSDDKGGNTDSGGSAGGVSIEMKKPVAVDEIPVNGDPESAGQTQTTPPSFEDMIKEKTGGKFTKWEDIEAAMTATKSPEISFENDFSKTLFENIRQGKVDEVLDKLSLQAKLKNIDNMKDDDAVKLAMKLKHPGWDDDDVADEYNDMFDGLESDDKSESRAARRKFKDSLAEARQYLTNLKADIKLPEVKLGGDIDPALLQQHQQNVDNLAKYREQYLTSLGKTADNFKGYEFKVEDDDMKLNTSFSLDENERKQYLEGLKDFDLDKFFDGNYVKDGNYDTDAIARDLWMIQRDDKGVPNYQKLIASQLKQVLTEAKRAVVASIKGRDTTAAISQPADLNKTTKEKEVSNYFDLTA